MIGEDVDQVDDDDVQYANFEYAPKQGVNEKDFYEKNLFYDDMTPDEPWVSEI